MSGTMPERTAEPPAAAEPGASAADPDPEPERKFVIELAADDRDLAAVGLDPGRIEAVAERVARLPAIAALLPATAVLTVTDDAGIKELNGRWRGKGEATNVLSFPARVPPGWPADEPRPLGDVVLATETVHREATDLGVTPRQHATHLLVHGLLHLVGYDHDLPAEAEAMEALEVEVLADLGVPDPYAGSVPVDAASSDILMRGDPRTSEP
jgi:probable rRNA maturation factor